MFTAAFFRSAAVCEASAAACSYSKQVDSCDAQLVVKLLRLVFQTQSRSSFLRGEAPDEPARDYARPTLFCSDAHVPHEFNTIAPNKKPLQFPGAALL